MTRPLLLAALFGAAGSIAPIASGWGTAATLGCAALGAGFGCLLGLLPYRTGRNDGPDALPGQADCDGD